MYSVLFFQWFHILTQNQHCNPRLVSSEELLVHYCCLKCHFGGAWHDDWLMLRCRCHRIFHWVEEEVANLPHKAHWCPRLLPCTYHWYWHSCSLEMGGGNGLASKGKSVSTWLWSQNTQPLGGVVMTKLFFAVKWVVLVHEIPWKYYLVHFWGCRIEKSSLKELVMIGSQGTKQNPALKAEFCWMGLV